MRFKYSTTHPGQTALDSLPRIPLILQNGSKSVEVAGLVDSGASINVLPFSIGQQLGLIWDDRKATIQLAGTLKRSFAMPVLLNATLEEFPSVKLAFAWIPHDEAALILGQTNFFSEFEICFFRSQFEFEIKLKKQA